MNRTSPVRSLTWIGKYGGRMNFANASPSGVPSASGGPNTSRRAPLRLMGMKNGRPCTWSQWRCETSAVPANGSVRSPIASPQYRRPVPRSHTIGGCPATSKVTQDVLPP